MGKKAIKADRRRERSEEGKDGFEVEKSECRGVELPVFPCVALPTV